MVRTLSPTTAAPPHMPLKRSNAQFAALHARFILAMAHGTAARRQVAPLLSCHLASKPCMLTVPHCAAVQYILCSELLAIVAQQEAHAKEEAAAKKQVAYLQDIHLALVLQRLDQQSKSAFLETSIHVSKAGTVCVVLHNQQLGSSWRGKSGSKIAGNMSNSLLNRHVGRAQFVSLTTRRELHLDTRPETRDCDSVFEFQPPNLCDEWTVDLTLIYEPQYELPRFMALPIAVSISTHHIDALDAIAPCSSPANTPAYLGPKCELPNLCEIWLVPAQHGKECSFQNDDSLARRLLFALLFENLPPQAAQRISAIMVGSYSAEFCLLDPAARNASVSVMCIPEDSHLSLHIRSSNWLAYSAVVAAIAGRLILLLQQQAECPLLSLCVQSQLQTL
ncbi:hypothetical protein BX667DRAFT_533644 [Coemansia mojavensis]|nr:hypothetical protein BX667DRAFT_533644 [Coemansia mojavensis]